MLQWIGIVIALGTAALALSRTRKTAKKLERLTETYWDLRYEHGQLRSRLASMEPPAPPAHVPAGPPAGSTAFVPLSSLRR